MADKVQKVSFFKSIKLRAWLGIFIITILPLFLLGLYSFDALGSLARDILIEGNIHAFKQVKYEVDQYVTTFDDLIKYLATDERFRKPEQFESAVEAMRHIDQSYESVERIIWVDSNGNLKAHSKREVDSYKKISISEEMLAKSNKSFDFKPEAILIKAKVSDSPDADSIIATISFLHLRKSLEGITFGTNFRYFLVTEKGENILEQPNFPKDVIAELMDEPCGAYDLLPESENTSSQIAISLPILHYGLKIFVFQDSGEVYATAKSLGDKIKNFIILLAVASFLLAIYISNSITGPVAVVAEKAIEFSQKTDEIKVDIEREDELGYLAKSFNSMSQSIVRKITEINALYKVTNYISTSPSSKKALDLCLEHIVEIFKAKRGSIMLINNERMALVVESFKLAKTENDDSKPNDSNSQENNSENITSSDDKSTSPVRFELKIGEGIAGKVVSTGEPILCMDCLTDDRFKDYSDDRSKSPKTLVAVPLRIQNKVIGVVNLSDRSNSKPFTQSDLDLLQAIADQMAMSIDNARLHDLSVINEQTDLYLRKFLEIRLDDEIKRSRRFGFPLTVVMFAIDGYAELNSKNGAYACDAALYDIGKLLKQTVRATDIPAEYDTNKLCAVLAHTSDEQAKMFADRFIETAKNLSIKRDEREFHITLSAGICQYTKEIDNYSLLLEKSDEALAESKKVGNKATIYQNNQVKEQNNE